MNKSITMVNDFSENFPEKDKVQIAQARRLLSQVTQPGFSHRPRGADVAAILSGFHVDIETILAAILSDPVFNQEKPDFDFSDQFGATVSGLVHDVNWLNHLQVYSTEMTNQPDQTEILRRMLLSVVKDVRAVLIKLAFRVQRLRNLDGEEYSVRCFIAQETLDIYAPIANRLGVSQLKWELEDMAFRYLRPQTYSKLVKSLAESRGQREERINLFVEGLQNKLEKEKISAEIAGRPKHLYSISKKMQRKQQGIDELYDLLAVRVIVDKLTTCYAVLGIVHDQWQYIPKEFDDYIANPKTNGYQSLHTVVLDQEGHRIEVQIRTQEMHEVSELGVAAHWCYKEEVGSSKGIDKKIASLRKLLEDKEDEQLLDGFKTELFYDRVYVLTPAGKLIDLVKGSTPLDFAYAIHTEVGHHCRGAKVNGRIVPLSYQLKTGEQVEIIAAKEGNPNPQWIDPNLGYLKSPRAITRVKGWIAHQNADKNLIEGRKILEKICLQAEQKQIDLAKLIDVFKQDDEFKLLAAIGRGDIKAGQILNALKIPRRITPHIKTHKQTNQPKAKVLVDGISQVVTSFAHCCKPVDGEEIIGFITHYKGITIHHKECENIAHLSRQKQTQLITVSWDYSQKEE